MSRRVAAMILFVTVAALAGYMQHRTDLPDFFRGTFAGVWIGLLLVAAWKGKASHESFRR